jgi:3-phenylpropionate/cinnamic acid dioxygenase small subunit
MALTVEDRMGITEMLVRYAHLVDDRDWNALRDLFTVDAVFDLTSYGLPSRVGIEAVMDFFMTAQHPSQHYSENIDFASEECPIEVRSKWLVAYPRGRLAGGDYVDQVRSEANRWRLASRTVIRRWASGSVDPITERVVL